MTAFEVFVDRIYWAARDAGGKHDVDTIIKLVDMLISYDDDLGRLAPGKFRRHRIVRQMVANLERRPGIRRAG